MARKALVELIGDPDSLIRSFKKSSAAAGHFQTDLKQLAVTAKQSADAQIQAAVRKDARLRQEIKAYRDIASSAKRGSKEQITAARLAEQSEGRLARSIGVTAREQRQLAASANRANRSLGQFARGGLAGSGAFRAMGRSIAFASGGFLSFAIASQGIKTSIAVASDLSEQINKTRVVFKDGAAAVIAWSRTTANSIGLARNDALGFAGTFGNMLVPMGFARKEAAAMSVRLVKLAGDLASFNNASPQDTLEAIRSGLAGETEPLRRFGVFLSQARIQAEAMSLGLTKASRNMGQIRDAQTKVDIATAKLAQTRQKYGAASTQAAQGEITLHNAERALQKALQGNVSQLTAAQKAQATYAIILKDTSDASGDFARTSGGLANQQRILRANWINLEAAIGKALLPTTLKYTRSLADWLGKSKNQERVTQAVKDAVRAFGAAVKGATAVLVPMARYARGVAQAVGGWRNAFAIITAGLVTAKLIQLVRWVRNARLAMLGLTKTPWAIVVTVTVIGLNAAGKALAKKLGLQGRGLAGLGDDVTSGADLNPVKRNGVWVNPVTGKAVPNQRAAETFARRHLRAAPASPEDIHPGLHAGDPARERQQRVRASKAVADAAAAVATAAEATARRRRTFRERLDATPIAAPLQLQIDQARAEATNSTAGILAVAREIRAWVLKVIKGLRGQRLISAYAILGQANDTIAAAAKEAADKAKQKAEEAKRKLQEARDKMAAAVESIRQQIGELFQGPILAPTEQQTKARLGVPGPKATDLTRDLRAQTALFARFNRDLAILAKRGAPKELLKELRAKGPEALGEVEALVAANRKTLNEFFRAFRGRERLVQRVAKVEMRAANVSIRAAHLHVQGAGAKKMAQGGIAMGPTMALIGESGPEAVVPLSRMGGGAEVIHTHVHLDSREVAHSVTRRKQRSRTSTAQQVRGRFPGFSDAD